MGNSAQKYGANFTRGRRGVRLLVHKKVALLFNFCAKRASRKSIFASPRNFWKRDFTFYKSAARAIYLANRTRRKLGAANRALDFFNQEIRSARACRNAHCRRATKLAFFQKPRGFLRIFHKKAFFAKRARKLKKPP